MNISVLAFIRFLYTRGSNAGDSAPGPPRFFALRTEGQRAPREKRTTLLCRPPVTQSGAPVAPQRCRTLRLSKMIIPRVAQILP